MDQLHYTSSDRNLNGKSGFGIRARTPSLSAADGERIAGYAAYERPREAEAAPVSFSFFRLDEDVWALSRTQYVGTDESAIREGNFFFHAVRLTADDLDRIGDAPIRCADSPIWRSAPADLDGTLPPLPDLRPAPAPDLGEVRTFLRGTGRRRQLAAMLHALATLPETNRRLVLIDRPEHVARWIEALTLALPARIRRDFTFSTYQHGVGLNFALTATRLDAGFAVDAQLNYQAYWVFDFEQDRFSPLEKVTETARFLADRLAEGETDELEGLSRMAAELGMNRLADLSPLVALRQILYEGRFPDSEREIGGVEAILKRPKAARSATGRVAAELAVGAMAVGGDRFLSRMLQIALRDSAPADAAVLAGRCADSLRSSLRSRGARARIELFQRIAEEFPALRDRIVRDVGPDDWATFLELASTTEPDVEAAMPLLRHAALDRGGLAAWRALGAWSARHGTRTFATELERLLDRRDDAARAIGRLCLDGWPAWAKSAPAPDRVAVACRLLASARDGENWEDDALRVSDQALEARNAEARALIARIVVTSLADRPEALDFVLEEIFAAEPRYVPPVAAAFAELPDSVERIVGLAVSGRLPELLQRTTEGPSIPVERLLIAASAAGSGPGVQRLARRFLDRYLREPHRLPEIRELLGEIPDLRQDPRVQGDLLLRGFASGPDLVPIWEPHFLPRVQEALESRRFPLTDAERSLARLCLDLSDVRFRLRGEGQPRQTLGEVAALVSLEGRSVSRSLYASYLTALFQAVPGQSRIEPLADEVVRFVSRIVVLDHFDVFAERFAKMLEEIYTKAGPRGEAISPVLAYYLPTLVARKARQPAVKRLVAVMGKAERDYLALRMEEVPGFAAYWEDVGDAGLIKKVLGL